MTRPWALNVALCLLCLLVATEGMPGSTTLYVAVPRLHPLQMRPCKALHTCGNGPAMQYKHEGGTKTFVKKWPGADDAGVGTKVETRASQFFC